MQNLAQKIKHIIGHVEVANIQSISSIKPIKNLTFSEWRTLLKMLYIIYYSSIFYNVFRQFNFHGITFDPVYGSS